MGNPTNTEDVITIRSYPDSYMTYKECKDYLKTLEEFRMNCGIDLNQNELEKLKAEIFRWDIIVLRLREKYASWSQYFSNKEPIYKHQLKKITSK